MKEKDYNYFCKYPRCIEAVEYTGTNEEELKKFVARRDPTTGGWGVGQVKKICPYLGRDKFYLALLDPDFEEARIEPGDWLVFEELPLGQNQPFIVVAKEEMEHFSRGNPPQGAFIDHN